jgi:hypothetical protein
MAKKVSTTTLKRNLERNIESFDEGVLDKSRRRAEILAGLCAWLITLILPLLILLVSANVLFRVPDLYSLNLSRSLALSEAGVEAETRDVAKAITGYLNHRTDTLSFEAETEEGTVNIFTEGDQKILEAYRKALDAGAFEALGCLLALLLLYAHLYRTRRTVTLRRSVRNAFVTYGIYVVVFAALLISQRLREALFAGGVPGTVKGDPLLPDLFGSGLFVLFFAGILGISLILIFSVNTLTRHLTREPALFEL